MININHQNDQACILQIADNSRIADAIPPQAGHPSSEGLASVPGVFERGDRSERGTNTPGILEVSFPKPLRCVGR
ncbi:hypothetical protein BJ956_001512 [Arthrobacter psychrochitiniphilus]|nr:hypothetical protein [Arthrobacter psychrochitiniphilus]